MKLRDFILPIMILALIVGYNSIPAEKNYKGPFLITSELPNPKPENVYLPRGYDGTNIDSLFRSLPERERTLKIRLREKFNNKIHK